MVTVPRDGPITYLLREDVHAHAATQYKEAMDARLAGRGLLAVANGGYPNAVRAIVDIDLTRLPARGLSLR